ncbi:MULTISPECIES: GNAT family N-acetyltransferase [unclassified Pseudonocardia]|jgi:hypothetical protein|uniref:GNAT family N-acetyltransferase n=1 Tax=unclassified Pseudonocardia TaxID=2619320 RepID=UPI0009653F69|nr:MULTISPECIES: GNAT family N-acetyltransferase [unclassified Pseudonocardia]MBN9097681.1 N-acetyltransferase [Pseudonocardia sp.]OJY39982.1 MAG: GNAT family N-acetyltransferase [Pseudonocardia sp. 73-21]
MSPKPMVLDVTEWSRFEIHVDGKLAGYASYRLEPGAIAFTHTEIDPMYGGHGFGGELVQAALDQVRRRELAVIPECPFVRGWLAKHPDYQDLVQV